MDNAPLISVIVPVYKTEQYLNKCISSITNQTYKNLEIILVDDGSPDRSGEICDIWAVKDSRIKVIHKRNNGGGAARNVALDIAQGQLIAFVDSDDYIAPDMYAHLYKLLEQGADIAECSYQNAWDDDVIFENTAWHQYLYNTDTAMALHIQDRAFRQLIWNKLYRQVIIGDIRFPEGKKIDDEFFTYRVLGNARKLIQSDKICYAYRQQKDSVMHSMSSTARLQAVEAKVQRQAYVERKFPALTALNLRNLWFSCLYQGQLALREMDQIEAKQVVHYLSMVLNKYPMNDLTGCTAKERFWLLLAEISFDMTCRLRNWMKVGL